MSNQELFARYEQLKMTVKSAEEEIETLKSQIVELIPEGKEVEGSYGIFNVQSRATWKFSNNHSKLKTSLKELEEEEKAKGIATAKYSPVLYYIPKKDE